MLLVRLALILSAFSLVACSKGPEFQLTNRPVTAEEQKTVDENVQGLIQRQLYLLGMENGIDHEHVLGFLKSTNLRKSGVVYIAENGFEILLGTGQAEITNQKTKEKTSWTGFFYAIKDKDGDFIVRHERHVSGMRPPPQLTSLQENRLAYYLNHKDGETVIINKNGQP